MEFTSYEPGEPIEGLTQIEDGEHLCVISEAKQSFDNDGNSQYRIVFQPKQNPSQFVWPVLKIGDNKRGVKFGVAIADALGIDRSEGLTLDPAELKGRSILITTSKWTDDGGRVNVAVQGVAPAPQKATKAAAARKPQTNAAAVATAAGKDVGGSDDVPF